MRLANSGARRSSRSRNSPPDISASNGSAVPHVSFTRSVRRLWRLRCRVGILKLDAIREFSVESRMAGLVRGRLYVVPRFDEPQRRVQPPPSDGTGFGSGAGA